MNSRARTGVVLMACLAIACAVPEPEDTSQADLAAIDDIRTRELAAFGAGDLETLRELFAADAVFLPPDEPAFRGHDALAAWVGAMLEQVSLEASYTDHQVMLAGDWAFEQVAMTLSMTPLAGGPTMGGAGKGVHIYQRQPDGTWKIVLDIWNNNAPAGGG